MTVSLEALAGAFIEGEEVDSSLAPAASARQDGAVFRRRNKLTAEELEQLFERYGAAVERRCLKFLRDQAEAEDACQEVFLRLVRSGESFEGRSEWMTWLYRVATNICLNRIRYRAKRDATWWKALSDQLPDSFLSPEGRILSRQLLDLVLGDCSEEDQLMLILHYLDGLPQREVAQIMKLSRATVNKRLQRIRGLAQSMAEQGVEEPSIS